VRGSQVGEVEGAKEEEEEKGVYQRSKVCTKL